MYISCRKSLIVEIVCLLFLKILIANIGTHIVFSHKHNKVYIKSKYYYQWLEKESFSGNKNSVKTENKMYLQVI